MLLSKGNSKMGEVPNVSLPPLVTCSGCADICGKGCYANRFYKMRPIVRKQWDANLEHIQRDMQGFFEEIYQRINKINYCVFRWHVGGDLINREHFAYVMNLAERLPAIRFLIFTKQFGIINNTVLGNMVPENLQIVFSAWPGLEMDNPENFPVAWMQDGRETRVPENAILCSGSCASCGMCFDLKRIGRDVVFHKH